MTREEFIIWLDESSGFRRDSDRFDNYWREEADYANCLWDTLEVFEESVEFEWEEQYWRGSAIRKDIYTFDAFKEKYDNTELKY